MVADEARDQTQAKPRILQVFEYLKALHAYRSPAERQIGKQRWSMWLSELPDHPSVRLVSASVPRDGTAAGELPDILLTVRRPQLTKAPAPPDALREWLETGWTDPYRDVTVRASLNRVNETGHTIIEEFGSDKARARALQDWLSIRQSWAKNEQPAREAMRCFERLYQLHGQLEREGETHELVVGNGLLSWKVDVDPIFHPVHVQSVQLTFDAQVPEFSIRQTDAPSELYTALFANVPNVEGRVLAAARDELRSGGYHPLADQEARAFLRAFAARLAVNGEFVEHKPDKESEHPVVGLAPVLFLRSRAQGFAAAIDQILASLASTDRLPAALARIVGRYATEEDATEASPAAVSVTGGSASLHDSLLFSKPANEEQYRIAANLEQQSCVLVQGPPGTGKSHTIANLIGHLLAKGERVLVTAHTTKALRVLRDQVVDALRPLCVSVLDDELASRRELELAVSAIVERLSRSDPSTLARERDELARQRAELVGRVRLAEQRVVEARATEYREIVLAGQSFEPSRAARQLAQRQREDGWISGPVVAGAPLPLSEGEIDELYATNRAVSVADEVELQGTLPELTALPSPSEFTALVTKRTQLERMPRDYRADLWSRPLGQTEVARIESMSAMLVDATALLPEDEPWRRAAALAAFAGGEAAELWTELIGLVEGLLAAALRSQGIRLQYGPELAEEHISDATAGTLEEIIAHIEQGGTLSGVKLLFNPGWRELIRIARVDGQEPRQGEHFRALLAVVEIERQRRALRGRWDRQVAALGGPPASALGSDIETVARQYAQVVREAMTTGRTLFDALQSLQTLGIDWTRVLAGETPRHGPTGEMDRIVAAIEGNLLQQLMRRANARQWADIDAETRMVQARASDFASNHAASPTLAHLDGATRALDINGYREAYERLARLLSTRAALARRRDLLRRLEGAAPSWASAVRHRQAPHDGDAVPGNASDAWVFRQLADEIGRRQRLSLEKAQDELERAKSNLRRVTAELIDRGAWERQTKRTSLTQRQALIGWLDTIKRIGKGTGKRAGLLRQEAQRLMTHAAEAVPVWVMPLSRVVHNFDPSRPPFDVVIIDEASQMDVLGLIAIYLGKKVVVVGDHEQVSPLGVGQDLDAISKLISEHLEGIPNAHLYDGRQSVYDLARQSFGGTIRLVEHFRCVPQIIEFSNWLSYGGDIKPLRDASSSNLLPHVVPHRVQSHGIQNKVNREEGMEIVALIAAACEDRAFEGKTFGVISLVGDDQATFIDEQLRKRIRPEEHAKRRLICGNPSQFQGDERDVTWLSVVDVPDGGPLRMRNDQTFQQRYNVAASRARDQMWVVYSLDPAVDLKSEDLRRRLIEHALDPNARERKLERAEQRVDSEFERQVLRRLHARGFRVRPQWEVGHYRIDLVVEGGGKRLAVECDGDRYHTIDNLQQDLARQATLERLGWKFVRIRGTLFFQDAEAAMAPVFEALEMMEIAPELSSADSVLEAPDRTSELRERLLRRAAQIKREWAEMDTAFEHDAQQAQ
jgi:very-short-patch-repair endonuclease